MKPGDAIAIPVEVRHWHGAAKDSWFSHIVVYSKAHEGFHAEWCEPVPQEIYDGLE
jgi:quercetin dioxygenase-like cupin family protein